MQALYALLSSCTSIVAEEEDGTIAHGRILDFHGAELLRRRTFVAKWFASRADEQPIFASAQFAGLFGVLTGMGKGFGISINQRVNQGGGTMGILSS